MYSIGYSCQILIKLDFFWQIFEENSNIKFYENPPISNLVIPRRQTDMTKLVDTILNFAKVSEELEIIPILTNF